MANDELGNHAPDDPMPVVRDVDEEPGKIHFGQLRRDFIFSERGEQ